MSDGDCQNVGPQLSHHEGHVLAIIGKWQPVTAYFVRRAMRQRITTDVSDSPGSVYPAIDRLEKAGLVRASIDESDRRRTKQLTCTDAGKGAIQKWITKVDARDLVPEDSFRTRAVYADALDPVAFRKWLYALRDTLEEVRLTISMRAENPLCDMAVLEKVNALLLTEARLVWVDRAIVSIARRGPVDGN